MTAANIIPGSGNTKLYQKVYTELTDNNNNVIDVQNPLPIDGDSVYAKDIDVDNSDIGDFSGSVTDLFDDRTSTITTSVNNPSLTIALKRPIINHEITIVTSTGNFSNVTLVAKNAAGTTIETIDDSANNTKYTSRTYHFVDIDRWCVLDISFTTTDDVTLSFLFIPKTVSVDSHLIALKPDNTDTHINATSGGNLKISLEEFDGALTTVNADKTTNLDGKAGLNVNAMVFGRVSDTVVKNARLNPATESLICINYEHHEIHSGSGFTASHSADIGNGANMDVIVITPDTTSWAHLVYEIEAELETDISVFEAPTITSNGTSVAAYNRDRNSSSSATTTVFHTPTVSATGTTKIRTWHIGSGRSFGGGDRGSHEFVLKQNTIYLFRLTNATANNNYMALKLDWYEHTNRN